MFMIAYREELQVRVAAVEDLDDLLVLEDVLDRLRDVRLQPDHIDHVIFRVG